MQLNNDQTKLVMELSKFYNSENKQYFVLSGQAGVGKTTCMKFFSGLILKEFSSAKICMSAPTNKAVAVLSDSINDSRLSYKTIYSLLGLRMMANGEIKELTDSGKDSIGNYDLVVIDEGSMISSVLIEHIKNKTQLADTKIVIIGDKEQLPPVGELVSPVWTQFHIDYELTEVMRHQNSILTFVQSIRANNTPVFESPGSQVIVHDEQTFMDKLTQYAEAGKFHSNTAKAIAWRNVAVDFLNAHIRASNKLTNSPDMFVTGDRVVFKEPVVEGDFIIAATDEEGTVNSVSTVQHTKYPLLKAWKVSVSLDYGDAVTVYVIHKQSETGYQKMLDEFKTAKRWDLFWKLKEAFHNITYSYALTAHRSQGSTFEEVFVDAGDILISRNVPERTKCLYVACSRASKQLNIFP